MAATMDQRKAFLLEARMRGETAVEAAERFSLSGGEITSPGSGGDHSLLLAPITQLGQCEEERSGEGGASVKASMQELARELQESFSGKGKGNRLAPGTFAPREEQARNRTAFVEKNAQQQSSNSQRANLGAAKRKSNQPQRHPAPLGGKRRRSEEDGGRMEKELRTCEDKLVVAEAALATEKLARAEADRTAQSLRMELEREREAGAREAAAAAAKAKLLRKALEATLRNVADAEAREKRRMLYSAAFELGRAVYRSASGFGSGRDAWEEGDAERELRRRAAELLARREMLDSSKKSRGATSIEGIADEGATKAHLAALRRDEAELAAERTALEVRKLRHVREWTRVRDEDASRFRSRPLLHDRYLLLALLGKGGFSEVWLAYDLDTAVKVAVKFHQLDQRWSDDKKRAYVRHAAREYSITRDLDHPRVVKLFDVFEVDDDTFATVIEYCAGEDLDARLRARKTLPEKEARAIILQVLAGLHHLHSPAGSGADRRAAIIHYDLKPGNILFDERGDVKITDFGLSKIIPQQHDASPATSLELTSMGAGTYWYLPPECFAHDHNSPPRINPNVDVWSVGIILYQILFGARPFGEGQSQKSILSERTMLRATSVTFPPKPAISQEAKDFIKVCLTPSQADRPSTRELCDHAFVRKPSAS